MTTSPISSADAEAAEPATAGPSALGRSEVGVAAVAGAGGFFAYLGAVASGLSVDDRGEFQMMTSLLGHIHSTGPEVPAGPGEVFPEWMIELATTGFAGVAMRVGRTRC